MKLRTIAIGLAVVILASIISPATAIRNGQEASGSDLVVGIVARDRTNQRGCSGALIAPRVVFTAAHCLHREPLNAAPVSGALPANAPLWVSEPGVEIPVGAKKLTRVIAQFRDLRFKDSSMEPGVSHGPLFDFAVLILEYPIGDKTFDYIKLDELKTLIASEAEVLAIGYGAKSPTDSRQNPADPRPTKTLAKLRSKNIPQGDIAIKIQQENPALVLQTKLPPNVFMGGGDSGSPLWYQKDNKYFYLGAMCCSNGINAATLDSDPIWQDEFWRNNSAGEYYAAAHFEEVIKTAYEFLAKNPVPTIDPATVKKTITCVKGVTKRKITALNPKCPTGFKKKK